MASPKPASFLLRCCVIAAALAAGCVQPASAGGPRFVTGWPYFSTQGKPVPFFTALPLYYTDPGPLNARVSHAQADAMVAAAAAVWNVPTSALVLAQGGQLNEHLSSANVYFNGTTLVVPADVQVSSYLAKPIDVIYDTNGSVIDTLLGAGASDPLGCRQTGVVESVDGLDPDGTIHHALLLLNGRCVGTTSDQMTQMQYQLARAFGRVLGLSWSQLNDNVFTGVSRPNLLQTQYWPLMHPIDVLCNTYTYKCMSHPFSLRPDDLSALALLYPVPNGMPGKTSWTVDSVKCSGVLQFPTGEGMDGVNVTVTRNIGGVGLEAAPIASGITGVYRQQYLGNPVLGGPSGPVQSAGTPWELMRGYYIMARVPITGPWGWDALVYTPESINPLYFGDYAVGPYIGEPPSLSGQSFQWADPLQAPGRESWEIATSNTAAAVCSPGNDGSEGAPVAVDPSGLWSGQVCSDSHTSWLQQSVKAGHTWTLDVTALDDSGVASSNEVHPVLGVWNAGDPVGTLPTVAASGATLNGWTVGSTQLRVDGSRTDSTLRIAIADERGHGRPDFNYKARLLYADAVSPVQLGPSGGLITISGQGFRAGTLVVVNGVVATVSGYSATSITAVAPSMTEAGMTSAGNADIMVYDSSNGARSVIPNALSYGGVDVYRSVLISWPQTAKTGKLAAVPFAVRVYAPDGVTPVSGATVRFSATGSGGTMAACAASTCTVTTDAMGMARSAVTPSAAGILTLAATELAGGSSVQATTAVSDPVRVLIANDGPRWIAAGASASWSASFTATEDGVPVAGLSVNWSNSTGISPASTVSVTDVSGTATVTVSTAGLGSIAPATLQACGWGSACSTVAVYGVAPANWVVAVSGGAGQSVNRAVTLAPVTLQLTDTSGHPLQFAPLNIYQTVDAWEGVCPSTGRCAASPVLRSSQTTAASDAGGQVTLTPLEVPGVASVVNIAAVSGTQGFASLSLIKTP